MCARHVKRSLSTASLLSGALPPSGPPPPQYICSLRTWVTLSARLQIGSDAVAGCNQFIQDVQRSHPGG